jgi:hypothetical protein
MHSSQRLIYYDRDGAGQPIKLTSVSVASALEAILGGTAKVKHSQNILERAVQVRLVPYLPCYSTHSVLLVIQLGSRGTREVDSGTPIHDRPSHRRSHGSRFNGNQEVTFRRCCGLGCGATVCEAWSLGLI